ncbi:hypothetical protein [Paenibacillus sp. XY044]|uniref:hypothetical protein n=1 Tax=Paenibacillus sp. XY044 TaxID=2026089 RepID=UPI000B981273|nr:hypothetical protein [Paenibacillus sp. XY044]OZB98790.1 hypothetical protein CJP46_06540 [Paenibacillus sp. XY044]
MKALADMNIDNVPWHRLTTAYGRGTDIPRLIDENRYAPLAELIEHQGTLWQVTPWTVLVLIEELRKKEPEQVSTDEIELYLAVASANSDQDIQKVGTIQSMNELLDDQYLWPDQDNGDEEQWEEEEPRGYEPDAFYGYFYFSGLLLKQGIPDFNRIMSGNVELAPGIRKLLSLLEQTYR